MMTLIGSIKNCLFPLPDYEYKRIEAYGNKEILQWIQTHPVEEQKLYNLSPERAQAFVRSVLNDLPKSKIHSGNLKMVKDHLISFADSCQSIRNHLSSQLQASPLRNELKEQLVPEISARQPLR